MKRHTINKYIAVFCTSALLFTGCRKNFDDINTNPVAYLPNTFDPNYNLTSAQLFYTGSFDFAYDTWRGNLIYASTMMQGTATVMGYWAGDKYLLNEGYTSAYWGFNTVGAYAEQVKPIVDAVVNTKGKPQVNNVYQVARIWKALVFERITDLYGDVPYSEAGLGYYEKIYTPKYDKQQAIYTDLLKELDEAVNGLNVSGGDKVIGDMIYKGDLSKWKRFGNSLMLRVALRLIKIDETTARKYAEKAIAGGTLALGEDAFIQHSVGGARVTQNRNSQVLLGDGGQEHYYVKWSDTFINFLKKDSDPRLASIAVTQLYLSDGDKSQNGTGNANPAVQKGQPNGKDLSGIPGRDVRQDPSFTSFPDYSSPSVGMIKRDGPAFVMTYAQSEFLLAEAAQRWGIGGTPADHYRNGMIGAITYLGKYDPTLVISPTAAATFADAHPYDPAKGLQMINEQYWAVSNTMLDFYETWSNWRRSGYPQLVPVVYPNNVTGGTIPRRFPYPLTEGTTNTSNYNAASAAVPGGDKLSGRVWWDK